MLNIYILTLIYIYNEKQNECPKLKRSESENKDTF